MVESEAEEEVQEEEEPISDEWEVTDDGAGEKTSYVHLHVHFQSNLLLFH